MNYNPLIPALLGIFLFGQTLAQSVKKQPEYVVIGYVSGNGWTQEQIQANKLTHINYAFAVPAQNGELAPLKPKDETNLAKLVALKAINPDLKILLSVGGWGGCKYFSDAAFTEASRQKFTNSAVAVLKKTQNRRYRH